MSKFNVRVYGILINDQKQVLVSDELIKGKRYTKFPGGGLEFGEGTKDCLVREFMEEVKLKVEVQEHVYTTDFFQLSAFHPDQQIISIYYTVRALEPLTFPIADTPFQQVWQRDDGENELVCFRLLPWHQFGEDAVDLPIDKIAVRILKKTQHLIH